VKEVLRDEAVRIAAFEFINEQLFLEERDEQFRRTG